MTLQVSKAVIAGCRTRRSLTHKLHLQSSCMSSSLTASSGSPWITNSPSTTKEIDFGRERKHYLSSMHVVQVGHIAASGQQLMKTCNTCGETGHIAKDCPPKTDLRLLLRSRPPHRPVHELTQRA